MGQGLAGDRLGVLGVGLGPASPAAPLGGAAGLHLAHVIAGGGQERGDLAAQPPRALHADAVQVERHSVQPGQRRGQPLIAGGKAGHAVQAAALVKHRDGEGVLVRVDAGHAPRPMRGGRCWLLVDGVHEVVVSPFPALVGYGAGRGDREPAGLG